MLIILDYFIKNINQLLWARVMIKHGSSSFINYYETTHVKAKNAIFHRGKAAVIG